MSEKKIFVGRKAELEQFKKVLEDPQGQAILVVGHRGMGNLDGIGIVQPAKNTMHSKSKARKTRVVAGFFTTPV